MSFTLNIESFANKEESFLPTPGIIPMFLSEIYLLKSKGERKIQ